jgi:hypothetical protein
VTRWRFVIHGGVDGFSRAVVFLGLSDNNRADTVLNLFSDAVDRWGLPSRVRYVSGTFVSIYVCCNCSTYDTHVLITSLTI